MSRAAQPHAPRLQPRSQRPRHHPQQRAVVAWGLVLAVAMLSFFVHLVSDHMARAQAQHQALHQGQLGAAPARAVPVLALSR